MKKYILTIHALVAFFVMTILLLPTHFTFLAWNVFLALIPFDLSLIIYALNPKYKWLSLPILFIWLIFYPNTIYMITDFAHLSAIGTDLFTTTQILNYSLLATGIFLGVSMGLASARLILNTFFNHSSQLTKLLVFTGLSTLSSYAIYIGRYLRLNSWDLLLDFQTVLVQMHEAFTSHAVVFIFIFTALQVFLMLVFAAFNPNQLKNEQTSG